jgi:DNA polymerase I-like protein with 3'-5' exonuclease and polymerase domains
MNRLSSNTILTPRDLREKVKYYLDRPMFSWDTETMGGENRGDHVVNNIVWNSFSTDGDTFVLPIGHPNGNRLLERERRRKDPATKKFIITPPRYDAPPTQIRPGEAFEILYPLLYSKDIAKTGSGIKFDVLSVAKYYDGELMPGPFHDTTILEWLVNENLKRHGLKEQTERRYKRVYDREHVGRKVEVHPFNKVARYAYLDAKYAYFHTLHWLQRIEEEGLQEVYALEQEVFEVLCRMEHEGTLVDVDTMTTLEKVLAERRVLIEGDFYRAAGKKINMNSNPQKVDLFYGSKADGNLGLKPWKLTLGGLKKAEKGEEITLRDYSTDKEALEKFRSNKVVKTFLDYQEVDRVLGTYIHGYLGWTPPPESDRKPKPCIIFDGKVYPDFVQYGTVTGRFSCREPNLQNIPRPDSDLGKEVRSLFIAGAGHKLIVSDYGQVELVVLAHFVGKGALYDGFFQGIDPHTMTAALVFDQDPVELTQRVKDGDPEAKHWRQIAKNLNFAIVYGAGPDKVASMSGITLRKAKEVLAKHEREFPEIYEFKDQALRVARGRKPPHLRTLMGRKRRVTSLNARDYKVRGRAERQSINSLIQGSAADLIKVAMVRVDKALREEGCGQLILTVHDELVIRARDEDAERCAEVVREAMVGAGIQQMVKVPLSIDLKVVDKWADAK